MCDGFLAKRVKSFLMSIRVSLSLRSWFFMYWMELSNVVGDCSAILTVIISNDSHTHTHALPSQIFNNYSSCIIIFKQHST